MSSSQDAEFPPVPQDTTWEHVLEHVQNPEATVELMTPPTLLKGAEQDPVSESVPMVNLYTVYPNPSPTPKAVEVVDFGEEEEALEVAKPTEEGPTLSRDDPVAIRMASKELNLPGLGKQPEETGIEEDEET